MMRSLFFSVVGLLVLGVGLLHADDRNTTSGTKVEGTIQKVDAQNHTITVTPSQGTNQEFKLNDNTRLYTKDQSSTGERAPAGTRVNFDKLHEGMRVSLVLDAQGSDTVKEIWCEHKSDRDR
jgi:hypothetical protein